MALRDWLHERGHGEETPNAPRWPRLLTYLVHWPGNWPTGANAAKPLDLRATPLPLPADWPRRNRQHPCLSLQPREVEIKQAALGQYQTQQRAMGPFLAAFVRSTECVSVLTERDVEFIWEACRGDARFCPNTSATPPTHRRRINRRPGWGAPAPRRINAAANRPTCVWCRVFCGGKPR
ncbi:hypothetical protein [Methylogaea oryzae]|uniref:hypothetical protein n=1 Tax=Methylogaea oryzae TaxID=1295382 RepID=UPI0006D1BD31|nr:hypothetical protein [Methylogaea oryzae]